MPLTWCICASEGNAIRAANRRSETEIAPHGSRQVARIGIAPAPSCIKAKYCSFLHKVSVHGSRHVGL